MKQGPGGAMDSSRLHWETDSRRPPGVAFGIRVRAAGPKRRSYRWDYWPAALFIGTICPSSGSSFITLAGVSAQNCFADVGVTRAL